MEAGIGYPGLPTVCGGLWSFDEPSDLRYAPEVLDDLCAEPFHGTDVAIIATGRKRFLSVNRDSDNRWALYRAGMEIDQIRAFMTEWGESGAGLARLIGITTDQFSKSMKGKRRFTVREMDILRRYFGADTDKVAPLPLLPIVGLISAGAWREGFEHIMGYMPSPDKALSAKSFVVLIEGDSMDKVALPGDGIIVDPTDLDLVSGKYYVIRNGEGETTFKQYREGPARLEPCSSNLKHQTVYPGRDEFTVIGRVRKRVADL